MCKFCGMRNLKNLVQTILTSLVDEAIFLNDFEGNSFRLKDINILTFHEKVGS